MSESNPKIELIYWRDCPSWERALKQLLTVVAELKLPSSAVESREIVNEQAALHESFYGSPTIKINGKDIQPPETTAAVGLSCRVYRRADGRFSPLPDTEKIRSALLSSMGKRTDKNSAAKE